VEKRFADMQSLLLSCLVRDEYPDTAPLIASLTHVLNNTFASFGITTKLAFFRQI